MAGEPRLEPSEARRIVRGALCLPDKAGSRTVRPATLDLAQAVSGVTDFP